MYETWQQSYPRDAIPYFDLVFIYGSLGSWDKALGEAREAMRLDSSASPVNYLDLGGAYQNLNRLDEAEAVYKEAEQRKIVENEVLLWNHYMLAFLRGRCGRDDAIGLGCFGQTRYRRSPAGCASGYGRLVWEVEKRTSS